MLGETFEDTRSNFVAEKVSHSPWVDFPHSKNDNDKVQSDYGLSCTRGWMGILVNFIWQDTILG